MDESANISANKGLAQGTQTGRRGRPKGLPKPHGSGRTLGVPNRITRDIRATAAKHSTKAINTLVRLLSDPDTKVRAVAAREILDRAHGRPMTPQEITGKDGAPLNPTEPVSSTDLAHRINFLFAKELHKQGFSVGKDGAISAHAASSSAAPSADRRAEIEAAQAAMATPTPSAPGEKAGRSWPTEEERFDATRREEQGLASHNQFNVARFRPNGR